MSILISDRGLVKRVHATTEHDLCSHIGCDFVTVRLTHKLVSVYTDERSASGHTKPNRLASDVCNETMFGAAVVVLHDRLGQIQPLVDEKTPLHFWTENDYEALRALFKNG